MRILQVDIEKKDVEKLLAAASPDGALLYLYLKCGNSMDTAAEDLHMSQSRLQCAGAILRQMGLYQEERPAVVLGERPRYTEADVIGAREEGNFQSLCNEVGRTLGRPLTNEELKILLGMMRYLGMSTDVIHMLVCHCRDRARQKGKSRMPSLYTIEKTAYAWAEMGINSVEEVGAYTNKLNLMDSKMEKLKTLLQIRGRSLTQAEEQYATAWLEMGFEEDALALAYERTCLNTGGLSWAYMNKILLRWHEAGFHSAKQVKEGGKRTPPKGASGQFGQAEMDAIARAMKEV